MSEFQRICEHVFEETWSSHLHDEFCKKLNCYCNNFNCEECLQEAGYKGVI